MTAFVANAIVYLGAIWLDARALRFAWKAWVPLSPDKEKVASSC